MDVDGATQSIVQLEFGPETTQDKHMQLLGIGVNLHHKLVICTVCHFVIPPEKLYQHIRTSKHHEKRDFKKGQRLAFVTREFCTKFINTHHLEIPQQPKCTIPAIPGLAVRTNMMICSHCGYAVQTKTQLSRHIASVCPQAEISTGPAQKFLSSHGGYFGVQLPTRSKPNPLNPATLFLKQFASDPYDAVPIQAATHPREMNLFLATENWLIEVDGMTGHQITGFARGARPDLRVGVKKNLLDYIQKVIKKLIENGDSAERLAIGDYTR
jgi:hypothetical protein